MAQKISDYTAKTLDFVDGDLFEVSKFDGATYATEKFTWLQLKQGLGINYKSIIFNFAQSGASNPVFYDQNANPNCFVNNTGAVLTLTRSSLGVYDLTSDLPIFDKYKVHIGLFHQKQGATLTAAIPLFGSVGVEGFLYLNVVSDYVIRIRCVDASFTPDDISSVVGSSNPISFPEIKIFGL